MKLSDVQSAAMGGFSQYGASPDESSRWRPVVIAAVVILVIAAVVVALSRGGPSTSGAPAAADYSRYLQVSDLRLSTAENFVGGRVTYIEGKITNTGDKTVANAEVESIFRNTLGEIVDRQTQPLRIAASPLGNPDWVSLRTAPLPPGKTAQFRLTFEHISADWNMGYPELRFLHVITR